MPPVSRERLAAFVSTHSVLLSFAFSVVGSIAVSSADLDPSNPQVSRCAGVAFLMATLWMLTPIPISATALLPLVVLPLAGVMDGRKVAAKYMNDTQFVFIGSFLLAVAIEEAQLHKRIALRFLQLLGVRPVSVLVGFCVITFFLSMCLSNTATSIMLMPLGQAVANRVTASHGGEEPAGDGVAYSANIGGIATLTGTLPNLVFAGQLGVLFPSAPPVTFASWFCFCLPLACLMMSFCLLLLWALFCPPDDAAKGDARVLAAEASALGAMRVREKLVLWHLVALVVLWFFRRGLVWEGGWADLFEEPGYITDGTAAVLVSLSLYCCPVEVALPTETSAGGGGGRLLDGSALTKIPWDVTVLMGGGFALAEASKESGLARWLAEGMSGMRGFPPVAIIFCTVFLTSFVTEVNSNLAATNMLLPIVAEMGVVLGFNPQAIMVCVTIACSFAFMLPIATPPNAIAFSTKVITTRDMLSTGVFLNIASCILLTIWAPLAFSAVFGMSMFEVPDWADPT